MDGATIQDTLVSKTPDIPMTAAAGAGRAASIQNPIATLMVGQTSFGATTGTGIDTRHDMRARPFFIEYSTYGIKSQRGELTYAIANNGKQGRQQAGIINTNKQRRM